MQPGLPPVVEESTPQLNSDRKETFESKKADESLIKEIGSCDPHPHVSFGKPAEEPASSNRQDHQSPPLYTSQPPLVATWPFPDTNYTLNLQRASLETTPVSLPALAQYLLNRGRPLISYPSNLFSLVTPNSNANPSSGVATDSSIAIPKMPLMANNAETIAATLLATLSKMRASVAASSSAATNHQNIQPVGDIISSSFPLASPIPPFVAGACVAPIKVLENVSEANNISTLIDQHGGHFRGTDVTLVQRMLDWAKRELSWSEKSYFICALLKSSHETQSIILDSKIIAVVTNWCIRAVNDKDKVALTDLLNALGKLPIKLKHLEVNKGLLGKVVKKISIKSLDQSIRKTAEQLCETWKKISSSDLTTNSGIAHHSPEDSKNGLPSNNFGPTLRKELITKSTKILPNLSNASMAVRTVLPEALLNTVTHEKGSRPINSCNPPVVKVAKPFVRSEIEKIQNNSNSIEIQSNENSEITSGKKSSEASTYFQKKVVFSELLAPGVQLKITRRPKSVGILRKPNEIYPKRSLRWTDESGIGDLCAIRDFVSSEFEPHNDSINLQSALENTESIREKRLQILRDTPMSVRMSSNVQSGIKLSQIDNSSLGGWEQTEIQTNHFSISEEESIIDPQKNKLNTTILWDNELVHNIDEKRKETSYNSQEVLETKINCMTGQNRFPNENFGGKQQQFRVEITENLGLPIASPLHLTYGIEEMVPKSQVGSQEYHPESYLDKDFDQNFVSAAKRNYCTFNNDDNSNKNLKRHKLLRSNEYKWKKPSEYSCLPPRGIASRWPKQQYNVSIENSDDIIEDSPRSPEHHSSSSFLGIEEKSPTANKSSSFLSSKMVIQTIGTAPTRLEGPLNIQKIKNHFFRNYLQNEATKPNLVQLFNMRNAFPASKFSVGDQILPTSVMFPNLPGFWQLPKNDIQKSSSIPSSQPPPPTKNQFYYPDINYIESQQKQQEQSKLPHKFFINRNMQPSATVSESSSDKLNPDLIADADVNFSKRAVDQSAGFSPPINKKRSKNKGGNPISEYYNYNSIDSKKRYGSPPSQYQQQPRNVHRNTGLTMNEQNLQEDTQTPDTGLHSETFRRGGPINSRNVRPGRRKRGNGGGVGGGSSLAL